MQSPVCGTKMTKISPAQNNSMAEDTTILDHQRNSRGGNRTAYGSDSVLLNRVKCEQRATVHRARAFLIMVILLHHRSWCYSEDVDGRPKPLPTVLNSVTQNGVRLQGLERRFPYKDDLSILADRRRTPSSMKMTWQGLLKTREQHTATCLNLLAIAA